MTDGKHALSHMLVAGTTIWCIYNTNKSGGWKWVYGTYGTLCFYSFVGTWRYGNPQYGDDASRLYEFSYKCIQLFTLSCTVTQLYLHYGYELHYAVIHCALPILPLAMHLTQNEWEQDLVDGMVLANVISCIVISVLQDNYFGITVGCNYGINHFVLKNHGLSDVPPKILFNAGLCFFAFFAYRALGDAYLSIF